MSQKKTGRPLLFKTPKELQSKIEAYFDYCENYSVKTENKGKDNKIEVTESKQPKRFTIAGLARWLGCDRRTLVDYSERDEFLPAIKGAKLRIEEQLEECLYGNNVTGIIFNLKNNYGWKDKSEVDNNVKIGINQILDQIEAEN